MANSKYELVIEPNEIIEHRFSHKRYLIKQQFSDYTEVTNLDTKKTSYINNDDLDEYSYFNVDLDDVKEIGEYDGSTITPDSLKNLETVSAGGGVWLTIADVKGTPYYFVVDDREYPKILSLYDSSNEADDYYDMTDMVWSKEYRELTPGEKQIYKVMSKDYNKIVSKYY